jgi:prevent-host-death family protein
MRPTIGIRELKNRLSSVLRRVRQGETITVTDRNNPIALLVPADESGSEDLVLRLVETGQLSWKGGKPSGSARPAKIRGPSVSDAVLQDRR